MKKSTKHGIWIAALIPATGLILASLICSPVQAKEAKLRYFQPADTQRLKDVVDIAISPDREWVTLIVTPTATSLSSKRPKMPWPGS